ncbi:MAG: tetratricopeptide repeat protein [Polaromonas sp.]
MPTRAFFFVRKTWFLLLSRLLLLTLFGMSAAHADDYTEVNRLIGARQFSEALASADSYLASKPRDPQMRFLKGVIQGETAKTGDAIETFTQITQDYPELPEPYNNLAVLYASQSQFDKARATLEMAIRLNPRYATAHENLGDIYARLASQSYSRALQFDAGNARLSPKLALIGQLLAPAAVKTATPAKAQ